MRIPNVNFGNIEKIKERTLNIDKYIKPTYYIDWNEDEKSYTKFVKKIEKTIRSSIEYKEYINFLKEEIDMNQCFFFQNIDRKKINVNLEIHHSPLTLYDITSIILNYMQINELNITTFKVANEVMKCHYKGLVGLIPLSKTVHELVHNGEIFIPVDKVYGNFKKFSNIYKDGFTEDQVKLLDEIINTTKQLNKEIYTPTVLEREFTYIKVNGIEFPKKINLENNKIA